LPLDGFLPQLRGSYWRLFFRKSMMSSLLNCPAPIMLTPFKLPLAITVWMAAAIAGGSIASAQQPAPAATPFPQGVQISVVVSKPAKGDGYYEDKKQRITLRVKFNNTDLRQTYEGYMATISGLGQLASDGKVKKVLLQEQVTLSLAPGKVQEHVCEEIITQFDKVGYKHGYFYDGWIIVVKDPRGKIVQVKSTASTLEKMTELAGKITLDSCYNSKLKPVADPEGSSSSSTSSTKTKKVVKP
jgi:hypothetical protein